MVQIHTIVETLNVLDWGKRVSTLGAGRNCTLQCRNSLEEGVTGLSYTILSISSC